MEKAANKNCWYLHRGLLRGICLFLFKSTGFRLIDHYQKIPLRATCL